MDTTALRQLHPLSNYSPSALWPLLELLEYQGGFIATRQAAELGCSPRELRWLYEQGHLTRRYKGVYHLHSYGMRGSPPLDSGPAWKVEQDQRNQEHKAEVMAAWLALGPDSCAALESAARLHGFADAPLYNGIDVHMATPTPSRSRWRTDHWLEVHPWKLAEYEVSRIGDGVYSVPLPATTVDRTLCDLANYRSKERFVCALDRALFRRLITAADVNRLREANVRRKGSRRSRDWWELADAKGRAMSHLETRIRLHLTAAGVAPDALQYRIHDSETGQDLYVDMLWEGPPPLIVEADGKRPHTDVGPDGTDPFLSDRERQNRIHRLFPEAMLLRYTWADARDPRRMITEVRRALHQPA